MNIKLISTLFTQFHNDHPKYFGERQIAQLNILKEAVAREETLEDLDSETAHEDTQANRDVFFDVCKQLLSFVDENINSRRANAKTQAGKFFKQKVAQAKKLLDIEQDDEKLRTQIIKIIFKSDNDLYFEVQVFRWMEAYSRSNTGEKHITENQRNYINDILKQHLPMNKLFDEISTIISVSPRLKAKIIIEYQIANEHIEHANTALQPEVDPHILTTRAKPKSKKRKKTCCC